MVLSPEDRRDQSLTTALSDTWWDFPSTKKPPPPHPPNHSEFAEDPIASDPLRLGSSNKPTGLIERS